MKDSPDMSRRAFLKKGLEVAAGAAAASALPEIAESADQMGVQKEAEIREKLARIKKNLSEAKDKEAVQRVHLSVAAAMYAAQTEGIRRAMVAADDTAVKKMHEDLADIEKDIQNRLRAFERN